MGEVTMSPNRRQRGNIETLRSGAKRIRVYNGRDPITKRPLYVDETIPAETPKLDKAAQQARTRWLNRVDEQRAPRTNATVGELLEAYFEVVDIDRATMRGWRGKVKNHIQQREVRCCRGPGDHQPHRRPRERPADRRPCPATLGD